MPETITKPQAKARGFERVLIPSPLLEDDVLPTIPNGAAAVNPVPAGSTVASLGLAAFGLTSAHLFEHDVVNFGFDHRKIRILSDLAVAGFAGQRNVSAVGRLAADGTRAQDAIRNQLSYPTFGRQLELALREHGLAMPGLTAPGGAFTDTEGGLNVKVELARPQARGSIGGWQESVDYAFKQFQTSFSFGSGHSFGIGPSTKQTSGDLQDAALPNAPGDQGVTESVTVTLGSTRTSSSYALLKNMPRSAAYNRGVPWLRVTADALITLTFDASNTRDLLSYRGGTVTQTFLVHNAIEFGLAPELALELGLTHPLGTGIPIASGRFIPAIGHPTVPDDTVEALHTAAAMPQIPGAFALHVRVDAQGDFVVGDRSLTPAEFAGTILAKYTLAGTTLVLVSSRADRQVPGADKPSPADQVAQLTGLVVVAAAGPVQAAPDGSIVAAEPAEHSPDGNLRGSQPGHWTRIAPIAPYREGDRAPSHRQELSHDLLQALRALGFTVGDRPAFIPPPSAIVEH